MRVSMLLTSPRSSRESGGWPFSAQPQTRRLKSGLDSSVCNSSNRYSKNYGVSAMLNDSAGVRDVGAMSRVLGTTFGTDASMGGTRACFRDNGETSHFPVGGGCSSLPGDQNFTLLTTRGAPLVALLLTLLKAAIHIFRVEIIVSHSFRRVACFLDASCPMHFNV